MKTHSPRLLIFLVLNIVSCFIFLNKLQAGSIDFASQEQILLEQNLHSGNLYSAPLHCFPPLSSPDEDGDLEKDVDTDGNFSKDLSGPFGIEIEIMPLKEDYKSPLDSLHKWDFKNGFKHLSQVYETPYLSYFQPPKI